MSSVRKARKERERRKQENARAVLEPLQEPMQRRLRDGVLHRMLDDHMLESYNDISDLYHQLATALGAKTMKFEETIRGGSSMNANDRAAAHAMRLSGWHKACGKHGIESRIVLSMIADATSQNRLAEQYRMRIAHIRAHARASLCVWSLWRKRCDGREMRNVLDAVPYATRTQVMRAIANKPAYTAFVRGLR